MTRTDAPRRTDVILAVGTLALVLLAAAVVVVMGATDEFVAWALARHHNVLSWYVRPLFILPFASSPTGGASLASC